jgi:hypothetical protein
LHKFIDSIIIDFSCPLGGSNGRGRVTGKDDGMGVIEYIIFMYEKRLKKPIKIVGKNGQMGQERVIRG